MIITIDQLIQQPLLAHCASVFRVGKLDTFSATLKARSASVTQSGDVFRGLALLIKEMAMAGIAPCPFFGPQQHKMGLW